MEGVCRVCLADDRSIYCVANTALELTFNLITGVKLQQPGRPTAMCYVCVSQLRRCHTFMRTARESNVALNQWYQKRRKFTLIAHPLITFTKTTTKLVDIRVVEIKQEPSETDIKQEITEDDVLNDAPHVSHEDCNNTQISDDKQHKTLLCDNNINVKKGNNNRKKIDGVNGNIPDIEWVNVQDFEAEIDKTQSSDDVKLEILKAPDATLNVKGDSSGKDIASQALRSRKRINADQDIDTAEVKLRRSHPAGRRGSRNPRFDTMTKHGLKHLDYNVIQNSHQSKQTAKMLIFQPNGEQRLITFILPKQSCTLEEFLEQVNIHFPENTPVQCMQNTRSDCLIDFFVSIGSTTRIEDLLKNHPMVVGRKRRVKSNRDS